LLDAVASLPRGFTEIRKSGEIAPAYHWLTRQVETKNDVNYEYIKLNSKKLEDPKVKVRSLGKSGSDRHREWQRAISRRDAIVELEQQITMVENLIDRQKARSTIAVEVI
jgi:hypothetical protein